MEASRNFNLDQFTLNNICEMYFNKRGGKEYNERKCFRLLYRIGWTND